MAQTKRIPGWIARRGYSQGVARWIAQADRARQARRNRDGEATQPRDDRFEVVARELKEARH